MDMLISTLRKSGVAGLDGDEMMHAFLQNAKRKTKYSKIGRFALHCIALAPRRIFCSCFSIYFSQGKGCTVRILLVETRE